MRVLVFHGYLLRGTGSNVYNAELAQTLSSLGHEVLLFAQDLEAASLPWVDRLGTWSEGTLSVEATGGSSPGSGEITVYLPPIGRTLPVFVVDRYEGFEARAYPDLDDASIEHYIDANVRAIAAAEAHAGPVDAAVANHLIAGPAICARAGLQFAIKVHGSDLSYAVAPHPERFVPLAREGIEASNAVVVGSAFTADSLWKVMDMEGLEAKTRLGPPGVDTRRFRPVAVGEEDTPVRSLIERLESSSGVETDTGGSFARDPGAAAKALESFIAPGGPRAVYVGKLLVNKGVDLLLAAWPLVVARLGPSAGSSARLLVVGFGSFEDGLRRLWEALSEGDLTAAASIALEGRSLEGAGESGQLTLLRDFLEDPPDDYAAMAVASAGTVDWAGRLDHDEVSEVLPATDALVMPSTFPEAFGMVAAEAAACGVPFVSAAHSGMLEVASRLGQSLEPGDSRFLSFEVGSGSVEAIADALTHWLGTDEAARLDVSARLASAVEREYSWARLAEAMLAVARGDLDKLPAPGA